MDYDLDNRNIMAPQPKKCPGVGPGGPRGLIICEVPWAHARLVEHVGPWGNGSIRHTIVPEKHSLIRHGDWAA